MSFSLDGGLSHKAIFLVLIGALTLFSTANSNASSTSSLNKSNATKKVAAPLNKMAASSNTLGAPDFGQSNLTIVSTSASPDGDVEVAISWNGKDTKGNYYPSSNLPGLVIDGTLSTYKVPYWSPVSLYISNTDHSFQLETVVNKQKKLSSLIFFNNSVTPTIYSDLVSNSTMNTQTTVATAPASRPPALSPNDNPTLNCEGSGEKAGLHPGWSSVSSQQLTLVPLGSSSFGAYWCPAAAPNGVGVISYTLTSSFAAVTCETIETSCLISGVNPGSTFYLMATDETGSYQAVAAAVQNDSTPFPCSNYTGWCNNSYSHLTFPTYGNEQGISDCTFASIADWEEIALGIKPDETQVTADFYSAGGSSTLGLTTNQAYDYWKNTGVGGVLIKDAHMIPTDPTTLKATLDDPSTKAIIASINLNKGQNFAGNTMANFSYHWIVVDGYTPEGPLVVTWGQTLQMTWQQWNLESVTMWKIIPQTN